MFAFIKSTFMKKNQRVQGTELDRSGHLSAATRQQNEVWKAAKRPFQGFYWFWFCPARRQGELLWGGTLLFSPTFFLRNSHRADYSTTLSKAVKAETKTAVGFLPRMDAATSREIKQTYPCNYMLTSFALTTPPKVWRKSYRVFKN